MGGIGVIVLITMALFVLSGAWPVAVVILIIFLMGGPELTLPPLYLAIVGIVAWRCFTGDYELKSLVGGVVAGLLMAGLARIFLPAMVKVDIGGMLLAVLLVIAMGIFNYGFSKWISVHKK